MEEPIEKALQALERRGVRYTVGPLGTTLEAASIDDIFDAVRAAHDAVLDDVPRVLLQLTVDHRLDKEETASTLTNLRH